jgi:hypothetical protein
MDGEISGLNIVARQQTNDPKFVLWYMQPWLGMDGEIGGLNIVARQQTNDRFEVFTAVTMKNGVFWDVTPCGSCKNRRFGGT